MLNNGGINTDIDSVDGFRGVQLPFPAFIGLGQHGGSIQFSSVPQANDQQHHQCRQIGQHGQKIGRNTQRLQQILKHENTAEQKGTDHGPRGIPERKNGQSDDDPASAGCHALNP